MVNCQWNGYTTVAHEDSKMVVFDPEFNMYSFNDPAIKDKHWSLRMKDNILMRGGSEGNVSLWDMRSFGSAKPIHSFNKQGQKINVLDLS